MTMQKHITIEAMAYYCYKARLTNVIERLYQSYCNLKPDFAEAYNRSRDGSRQTRARLSVAIRDFNKAIELQSPILLNAYTNLATVMWLQNASMGIFKVRFDRCQKCRNRYRRRVRNAFGSIENFEQITGIQLPEDIAAMLISPQA